MKNKKLFAILTLVCFMMTLMPVAAFAAEGPVAIDTSAFVATDGDQSVKTGKAVEFTFAGNNSATQSVTSPSQAFMVWAVDANGAVSSALTLSKKAGAATVGDATNFDNVYIVNGAVTGDTFNVEFARSGKYTVYAGVLRSTDNSLNAAQLIGGSKSNFSVITVTGKATDPEATYSAEVTPVNKLTTDGYAVVQRNLADEDETPVTVIPASETDLTLGTLTITPNNVQTDNITVTFWDKDQKLTGKTVSIDTNSANIEVSKTSATTNILGQIQFKVSAAREGKYEIYLSVDGIEYKLIVNAGNTYASYIEVEDQPTAPIALYEGIDGDVSFTVTDINGNIVKDAKAGNPQGMDGIFNGTKYLIFTEKPSASTLENEDLSLVWDADDQDYDLKIGSLDAEGKYTVRAILDNGAYATATFEVKKFGTPVQIYMEVADTVELGKTVGPQAKYVDANGVTKNAKDANIAASGYAISYLSDTSNGKATVALKTDEKYAGTSFTLTAVSERYNLVATKEIKITGEGTAIAFEDKSLSVNVNNKVEWKIVDENGNAVKVDSTDWVSTKYVVLDKPENAKVTVYDSKPVDNGTGEMALTSNMAGNVTVQVVAQYKLTTVVANGNTDTVATQNKYYTGTKIFAVGNGSVGDVVVMSIGSNEIIINDKKATIDAEPIIQNDRTYVPFRALAEAFGATVAYDEATQAVTAELNGVTVVMTIGSATYTVNGAEKTMDVAPFINGSRTMVPVRFAAEAFGIKVIPTYNPDGSTADILFNL